MMHPNQLWSFEIKNHTSEDLSGLVVSRPDQPALYVLNQSAQFIWSALEKGGPFEFIVSQYAEYFGISLPQAKIDVTATIDLWKQTLLSPSIAVSPHPKTSKRDAPPSPASALFSSDYILDSTSFRLIAHDPDFVDEIRPRLAHLARSSSNPAASPRYTFHVFRSHHDLALSVFRDDTFLGAEPESSVARTILLQEIARLAYNPGAEYLAILHAGACASPSTNRAVILAAATNSGKSTLTAALLESGLDFLSDDSAAVIQTNQQLQHPIIPLPFALMLREGSWPILEPLFPQLATTETHHRNGDHVRFLPPPVNYRPATAKCLVFPQYTATAQEGAILHPINALQALCSLQKSGFWVPHTRSAIAAFLSWVQSLPAYQLSYSRLSDAVPVIHSLLAH